MRIAAAAIVLALVGGAAIADAASDPAPVAEGQEPPVAHPDEPIKPISADEQQPEEGGRSGFWTSRAPAKYGAYKWRLLGVGVLLVGITGTLMMRAVKRQNRVNEKAKGRARWKNEPVLPGQKLDAPIRDEVTSKPAPSYDGDSGTDAPLPEARVVNRPKADGKHAPRE